MTLPKSIPMAPRKRIALIAHDNKKQDMLEWARYNKEVLRRHDLFATGTTGSMLSKEIGLEIKKFLSGPLGGDQQVGAAITDGAIDFLIFFLGSVIMKAAEKNFCRSMRVDRMGLKHCFDSYRQVRRWITRSNVSRGR